MDDINYHWLETEEERRFVLDRILSLFQHRKPTGLETVEIMAERVFEDEDINSAEKILREFPYICTTIWRDDLFSSETYERALRSMLEMAPSIRAVIDIEDGSTETVKGDEFDVSIASGGQERRVTLRHQRFLDYNFLKLIPDLLEISSAPGKYYSVYSESVEEGFVFTYLDPDEYSDVMSSEMFGLNELNSKVIEDIISVYNAVEVPKPVVVTSPEVLDEPKSFMTLEDQVEAFKSLGYEFPREVTEDRILEEAYERTWEDNTKSHIENNPFSTLYYLYGDRSPDVEGYNYTDQCLYFDLEFFDPNSQYKWFMERLGVITHGEIIFSDISIDTDAENWEWITFRVNGVHKKWKLEKTGYIADHFVQRFSYLPQEFKTKGKYTFYCDGGQQWVIDYATPEEQNHFNAVTGLNREWLGEGNHFSTPADRVSLQNLAQDNNSDVEGYSGGGETLKVQIHIQGIGAAHEAEHGYREADVDPEMSLEKFIRFALEFKDSFLEPEYNMMASKQLCAVIRRTSSGAEIILKKNIRLKDLVVEGKPLKVSFGINKLNDAVIDYRMKLLIEKGVKHLDDVEAAWLGVFPGTDVNNFPDKFAGYPALQAVLRDRKSANETPGEGSGEEPEKVHWMYKLWSALRYIKLIIMPFR